MKRSLTYLVMLWLVLVFGCGGGGGSSNTQNNAPTPPPAPAPPTPPPAWKGVKQWGTPQSESALGIARYSGNIYVVGSTIVNLDVDGFITKFDNLGNMLGSRLLGTAFFDNATDVAADPSGNLYVAGVTKGDLGGPNAGGWDAFLAMLDPDLNIVWIEQFGTVKDDLFLDLTLDPATGLVYISGCSAGNLGGPNQGLHDVFILCFEAKSRKIIWKDQVGTSWNEQENSLALGPGAVYMASYTAESLFSPNIGGLDIIVVKYDPFTGARLGAVQLATQDRRLAEALAVDPSGNVYVAGAGNDFCSALVVKLDSQLAELWTGFFGPELGIAVGIAVGPDDVYVVGFGSDPGETSEDAFAARLSPDRNPIWIKEFGTPANDEAWAILLESDGLLVAGRTAGDFGGPNAGEWDTFLAKFDFSGNML